MGKGALLIMQIQREKALKAFREYVAHYDVQREMIRLKVEHTYRVASLCEEIAKSLGLSQEDVDLAWLIGLLHDVGRFEQQKNYGTFNDAISIDHAKYGAQILFDEGKIRDYIEQDTEDKLIWTAVYNHSAYRIPEDLDDRYTMFCNIIRDADKVDIFRVNVEFPLEEIYNVTREEMYTCAVTPAVMQSFQEGHAVLRSLKKVPVDNVVGHISLVYELVYGKSLALAKEQGYLAQLMSFESENALAREQFVQIRAKINDFLKDK